MKVSIVCRLNGKDFENDLQEKIDDLLGEGFEITQIQYQHAYAMAQGADGCTETERSNAALIIYK